MLLWLSLKPSAPFSDFCASAEAIMPKQQACCLLQRNGCLK